MAFCRWENLQAERRGIFVPFWASPPARERREQAMLTIHKTVEGKMTPLNSVTDG